jgi:hypothetical protein
VLSVTELANVATAVGVLVAVYGILAQNRQRKLGLVQLYVQRYWELDDAIRLAEAADQSVSVHHERYLRLCEDEYEVTGLGWIPMSVWAIWHEGIQNGVRGLGTDTHDLHWLQACLTCETHHAIVCPGLGSSGRWRRWRRRAESKLGHA